MAKQSVTALVFAQQVRLRDESRSGAVSMFDFLRVGGGARLACCNFQTRRLVFSRRVQRTLWAVIFAVISQGCSSCFENDKNLLEHQPTHERIVTSIVISGTFGRFSEMSNIVGKVWKMTTRLVFLRITQDLRHFKTCQKCVRKC